MVRQLDKQHVQLLPGVGKVRCRTVPAFARATAIRPSYQPGQYISAGPFPHLIDIWRAGAPSINFIAPDIYFPNFAEWTERYTRHGNPLFIPEALHSPEAAVNALYAFAEHDAIGFCPFGIESITGMAESLLAESYGVINESGDVSRGPQAPAGGLVIQLGTDEFLFAGIGITITFRSPEPGEQVGIVTAESGRFVDGQWRNRLWNNGDQTHQGRHLRLVPGQFDIQRVKLYRYR